MLMSVLLAVVGVKDVASAPGRQTGTIHAIIIYQFPIEENLYV
jgi:hypothetical protein